MPGEATQLERDYLPDSGGKARLIGIEDLDKRTRTVRRVLDAEGQIAADLGNDLTEGQRALARRAAVLGCVIEDLETRWATGEPLPFDLYLPATNVLRRLLQTIGVERRAKPANLVELMSE